jgi:hypothetical protein
VMSIGIPFRGLRRGTGQLPFCPPCGGGSGLSGVVGDFKATGVIATAAMAAARSHQCFHRQQIVGLLCIPSLALALARGTSEGFLWAHAAGNHSRGLPVLRLSFRDTYRSSRLADASLRSRASSPGVFQRPPLHRPRIARPLPGIAALRPGGATHQTRSALAVPPGFDGLRRTIRAGLLRPAAGPGVRHVSDPPTTQPTLASVAGFAGHPPRWRSDPSERSPRRQPRRVTAALALSPFHRVSRLCSNVESVVDPPHG